MTDIDAALVQQIFNIPKRKREPDVQHYRQADNLTARFKIAKWVHLVIGNGYETALPASGKLCLTVPCRFNWLGW